MVEQWPLVINVPVLISFQGEKLFWVYICSISITGRDVFNSVYHSSDQEVYWRVPVQLETSLH